MNLPHLVMNISPEQMRMASEMMKNMKPEDLQNMMKTFQQNPQMMEQASRMMQGNSGFAPPPPDFSNKSNSQVSQNEQSPFEQIISKKDKGNLLFKEKKFDQASVKYLECILDIENLRKNLTSIETSNSKFLGPINELEITCRNNYCVTKLNLEEYEAVLIHSEKVLLIDPINAKALFSKAQAHFMLEEFKEAKKMIDSLQNRIEKANGQLIQMKERLVNSYTVNGHIKVGLQNFYAKKYDLAIDEYNRALALDSSNYVLYDYRGYAQLRANKIDEAIASLEKSVTLNPEYGWGYYNLSLAYWANGDKSHTRQSLQHLTEVSPELKRTVINDAQFSEILKDQSIRKLLY